MTGADVPERYGPIANQLHRTRQIAHQCGAHSNISVSVGGCVQMRCPQTEGTKERRQQESRSVSHRISLRIHLCLMGKRSYGTVNKHKTLLNRMLHKCGAHGRAASVRARGGPSGGCEEALPLYGLTICITNPSSSESIHLSIYGVA